MPAAGRLLLHSLNKQAFPLTQLALGLIIIFRRCVYFCNFHIPNYFCYFNIILALMPQIPYLNCVRFPFFVPSEDCSCKIHGLRVGITKASGGLDIAGPQPASFFFPPCSLLRMGVGGVCWETWRVKLIYMWVTRILGSCKCIFVSYLGSGYQGKENNAHQNCTFFYESFLISYAVTGKWQGDPFFL